MLSLKRVQREISSKWPFYASLFGKNQKPKRLISETTFLPGPKKKSSAPGFTLKKCNTIRWSILGRRMTLPKVPCLSASSKCFANSALKVLLSPWSRIVILKEKLQQKRNTEVSLCKMYQTNFYLSICAQSAFCDHLSTWALHTHTHTHIPLMLQALKRQTHPHFQQYPIKHKTAGWIRSWLTLHKAPIRDHTGFKLPPSPIP